MLLAKFFVVTQNKIQNFFSFLSHQVFTSDFSCTRNHFNAYVSFHMLYSASFSSCVECPIFSHFSREFGQLSLHLLLFLSQKQLSFKNLIPEIGIAWLNKVKEYFRSVLSCSSSPLAVSLQIQFFILFNHRGLSWTLSVVHSLTWRILSVILKTDATLYWFLQRRCTIRPLQHH